MFPPGRRQPVDVSRGAPAPRAAAIAAVILLQLVLLGTGIHRDYRLKHEDNNALHATFARSHLQLGADVTRGHNYFYSPATGEGLRYPNHPPGPALALAAVYGATGSDGPFVTRATAIAFHIAGTWLFYGLARRLLRQPWEVVLALVIYAVLPESAFFGRMMNHEVLVLPAAVLMVRGYWEAVRGDWPARRWLPAVAAAMVWAALAGWAGFFVMGACALHAAREVFVRRNPRAAAPLYVLAGGGVAAFGAVIGHLSWAAGADASYLRELAASRGGIGDGMAGRAGRLAELHWRYFSLTSLFALMALAYRALRAPRGAEDPADDAGAIFLLAGAGYVLAFSLNATRHDYWQFLLLPASALAIVVAIRHMLSRRSRRLAWRTIVVAAALEMTATTALTLVQRHGKGEGYCIETVAALRRNHL